MSDCYRCHRDDYWYQGGFRKRRPANISRKQELVWVCPDCRDAELPVLYEDRRPSLIWLWPVLGWLTLLFVLVVAFYLALM